MGNNKLVDITGLSRYHENLKNVFSTKQDVINDLETIRTGAAAGAAALDAAKEYADGLAGNYDAAGAAAQALADAKADAAALYQVKGDYEAAGAAAQALADAKADAASLYQVKGDYEAAGTAAGLNAAMDERVKALEAIDHEKLATDASAAAVATVLDGAPEKFDTLKEVAEWISASDSASSAADLVTRVAALEAIDHDAYVDADTQVLADANAYADSLASNYDAAGAAATAEQNAKDYADGLATNYDAAGSAAQALVDAKAYVDGKVDGKFDAAGAAAQALADAKADAASLYQVKGNYETAGAAAQALADAKTYVDGKGYLTANDLVFAEGADIDALFA